MATIKLSIGMKEVLHKMRKEGYYIQGTVKGDTYWLYPGGNQLLLSVVDSLMKSKLITGPGESPRYHYTLTELGKSISL